MLTAKQWVLKNLADYRHPLNFNVGEPDSTFELITKDINEDDLKDGEILIKVLYLANDPSLKFFIAPVNAAYSSGIKTGTLIPSRGLAQVIKSKNSSFPEGAYVKGVTGWADYAVINDVTSFTVVDGAKFGDISFHLSVFGSTALTAYFIFHEIFGLKQNEENYNKVFLISAAAGAVGTNAIQLALNVFKASKVIAIAGGPEKVKYVESFGDKVVGVDYKDPDFATNLYNVAGGQNTVDYYVDNVGGETLDIATDLVKPFSIIAACGAIGGYNDATKLVFNKYTNVILKRLTLRGFIVSDFASQFPTALQDIESWVKEGKIDTEKAATIENATGDNFSEVPNIWNGLFHGANKGKLLTKIT